MRPSLACNTNFCSNQYLVRTVEWTFNVQNNAYCANYFCKVFPNQSWTEYLTDIWTRIFKKLGSETNLDSFQGWDTHVQEDAVQNGHGNILEKKQKQFSRYAKNCQIKFRYTKLFHKFENVRTRSATHLKYVRHERRQANHDEDDYSSHSLFPGSKKTTKLRIEICNVCTSLIGKYALMHLRH